jgi:poly(3-hydroxybutyrate) depolymerase
MDLAAEFYLQTVDTVFVRHALPKGEMTHRGTRVDPSAIRRVALFTIEGENDDISGVGQTEAAHRICANIPPDRKAHWLQPAVGHYGVFNGSRFRAEIVPRVADFVLTNNTGARAPSKRISSSKSSAAKGGNGSAPAHDNDAAPAREEAAAHLVPEEGPVQRNS